MVTFLQNQLSIVRGNGGKFVLFGQKWVIGKEIPVFMRVDYLDQLFPLMFTWSLYQKLSGHSMKHEFKKNGDGKWELKTYEDNRLVPQSNGCCIGRVVSSISSAAELFLSILLSKNSNSTLFKRIIPLAIGGKALVNLFKNQIGCLISHRDCTYFPKIRVITVETCFSIGAIYLGIKMAQRIWQNIFQN